VLETKLGKRLASLLFAARVHADTRPCGDALAVGVVVVVAVVVACVRVVRVRVGFFDGGLVRGDVVVEDFFDFGHLQWVSGISEKTGGKEGIDPSITTEGGKRRGNEWRGCG
jgi:hypothetical protein